MGLGETLFGTMFERTADALVVLDVQAGKFIDCNHAAVEMLGCVDKSEVCGRGPEEFAPRLQPDGRLSAEKAEEAIAAAQRDGSHRFEWTHCSAYRADFPVEVVLTPFVLGERQLIIGTLRDITQQKRDQKTQSALHHISEAAHYTATLAEMFRRIHQIIGELLPARNFFVALYDHARDELSFPYFVDEHDVAPKPRKLDDGTLSGRVIMTGEALLITPESVRAGGHQLFTPVGTAPMDWLGVALKSQSGTIGALVVQSYTGDVRYVEKDKALLEFVSSQVAAAIERKQAAEALLASEKRLEEAQRLGHLGSWTWDLVTHTLSWSDELCRIYGVPPASHRPTYEDYLTRVHPEDRPPLEALVARAMADHLPFSHETRIVLPDGQIRTIFDQGEVLDDGHGRVTGLAGACLDITDRKLVEVLERDRSLILEQVAQNRPLPEILSRVCSMLERQMPGSRCSILLLKDRRLWTGAAPRLPKAWSDLVDGLPIGPAVGACGTACFTAQTVITEDIATDPLWDAFRDLAAPHGLRACWSMPVPSNRGDVLGSFAVYPDQPSRPGPRELAFMEMATRLAAVAIEHRLLTDQLAYQAHHDALTALPNRLLFRDRLNQALARAERKKLQVAVLYMDLDRFKSINDMLGHSSGDALLRQAASRLQAGLRKTDTLARLGGDEFTAVLGELTDPQDAVRVATKLVEDMRASFQVDQHELFVTLSLGISLYPDDGLDSDTLMANADAAMYRAKEAGRDNFQWFAAEMNTLAKERISLDAQLRQALRSGQLSLHYQPQCGGDGAIQCIEALMRWHHPILGMVSPAKFIPLAEASGLIVPLGEWALRTACAQLAAWRRAGHPSLRIAVNVSAVQFKRADWVDTVRRALQDTQLTPDALELEITESLLLHNVSEISASLHELRALGVGIAIDDFGTGYSCLSYLHKLPVTTLKIDRAFVREIGLESRPGQEDAPIIRTIIALARNLGMGVVAEGVETDAQRSLLLSLGCESLQGYLLHRPMLVEQLELLLRPAPTP